MLRISGSMVLRLGQSQIDISVCCEEGHYITYISALEASSGYLSHLQRYVQTVLNRT
jgi:hypothetical protein